MSSNELRKSNDINPSRSPTAVQIGIAVLMIGSSAGMMLYTKRTDQMLSQMKKVSANQASRLPKRKPGPITHELHEKTKTRIDKDEFF